MSGNRMVIVTGLSGSGRSAALKAFEDIGYYCTDNLPLQLLAAYVVFAEGSAEARLTAIGIDVREKGFPQYFPKHLADLTGTGRTIDVLFLEATDQVLVRRFSETRRPHPLARGTTPLLDGIRRERDALGEVKGLADRVIDTSDYTVHDLRQAIERHYAEVDAGRPLVVTIVSFGYKFGIPYDLDLLFDLRFLPNPHFVEALKPRTGEDPEVSRYVLSPKESEEFVARFLAFLTFLLPRYRTEGKSYLTIGFGCTGGRHRSVAVSLAIAESLRTNGYEVIVKHRDIG